MTAILEMRLKAAKDAEAIGLLEAVKTVAQDGGKTSAKSHEWMKVWNGKRFFYGERYGDPTYPYAEVCVLKLSKDHPVHNPPEAGKVFSGNPETSVTGTDLLFSVENAGKSPGGDVMCLRSGPWTGEVLKEADRIRSLPPVTKASLVNSLLAREQANFAPYEPESSPAG